MLQKIVISLAILGTAVWPVSAAAAQPQPESITLEQCLEIAAQNNKQLQAAEKSVAVAKDTLKEAKAGFWPTLGYQVTHESSDQSQYSVGTGYEDTRLSAGVNASVPLYTGGMLTNNVKLAQIQLASAQEAARKARQQLTYDVKQAFYNVWLAEQVLQVQQASYDNLRQHAARVEKMFQAGTASKYELLQAEVQRDTLKPDVINAENQWVLAKLQLATLVGLPKERAYTVQYDLNSLKLPEAIQATLAQVLEEAYQNRPEIRQIRQSVELAEIQTALAEAGYKPNVALNLGYSGLNKDIAFDDWYEAWSLTVSVTGKFFDRSVNAKVDQSKNNEDLAVIKEADLRDQVRLEAEQSLQSLEVSLEKTRASEANIELARESLRLTEARFDAGMATTMDIMDAQLALDKNLTGYYQGIVAYLEAEAKLDLVVAKD